MVFQLLSCFSVPYQYFQHLAKLMQCMQCIMKFCFNKTLYMLMISYDCSGVWCTHCWYQLIAQFLEECLLIVKHHMAVLELEFSFQGLWETWIKICFLGNNYTVNRGRTTNLFLGCQLPWFLNCFMELLPRYTIDISTLKCLK